MIIKSRRTTSTASHVVLVCVLVLHGPLCVLASYGTLCVYWCHMAHCVCVLVSHGTLCVLKSHITTALQCVCIFSSRLDEYILVLYTHVHATFVSHE